MEHPERYDPEDLEHLMLERGFDELLDEERAYALRHLENRAEYERMRALLHHVREEKSERPPMDADPAVRERVLQAFRAQRQPRWTIWLNSLGGFPLPARPSLYWRPVLALGTLAVLVFTALVTFNSLEKDRNKTLAEVKQDTTVSTVPAKPVPVEKKEDSTANGEVVQEAPSSVATRNEVAKEYDPIAQPAVPSMAKAVEQERSEKSAAQSGLEEQGYIAEAHAGTGSEEKTAAPTNTADEIVVTSTGAAKQSDQRDMKDIERARTEAYSEVAADSPSGSPVYAEDDLIGLLRAAW